MTTGLVLIVDDDRLNRRLLSTNLSEAGYAVESVMSGREALDRLRQHPFDVVLLDLVMPDLDGYQVLAQIKATPGLQHIPVIIISNLKDMDSIVECIKLGATDYLPKPFDPLLLRARLEASLSSKRLADAEQAYQRELEARNEELDAFAHMVAHDLKNLATGIIGYADLLEAHSTDADTTPEERAYFLKRIVSAGRRMNNVIEELLLLASVRREAIEMAAVDMATVVDESLKRLEYMISTNHARITVQETWPSARGYGPWIEEVWVNYLSNAIKYGGEPAEIELGGATQPDGQVRFWVRDHGPGLRPEDQARLFVPFSRLDQVRLEGHGLGLSIVHRIIGKLDGAVGVESAPADGSSFWFSLPAG